MVFNTIPEGAAGRDSVFPAPSGLSCPTFRPRVAILLGMVIEAKKQRMPFRIPVSVASPSTHRDRDAKSLKDLTAKSSVISHYSSFRWAAQGAPPAITITSWDGQTQSRPVITDHGSSVPSDRRNEVKAPNPKHISINPGTASHQLLTGRDRLADQRSTCLLSLLMRAHGLLMCACRQ